MIENLFTREKIQVRGKKAEWLRKRKIRSRGKERKKDSIQLALCLKKKHETDHSVLSKHRWESIPSQCVTSVPALLLEPALHSSFCWQILQSMEAESSSLGSSEVSHWGKALRMSFYTVPRWEGQGWASDTFPLMTGLDLGPLYTIMTFNHSQRS